MLYKFLKRALDFIVSLLAIIFLTPIFIPIIILLKLTAEREVFYSQERIGINNSRFKIYKFATMLKNSENLGTKSITLKNDFRVTKVGKYLRITKINELPQLFNILKGDISIVGPRPLLDDDYNAYPENIRFHIYNIKPGLTGVGSIVFRDEESIISKATDEDPHEFYKRVIAPYKGELEMWYQSKRSFLLDLKLIILTACAVIFPFSNLHQKWLKDLPKRDF